MCGKTPVYKHNGSILKASTNAGACDNATCDWSANGYRLPTEGEWQYAASYCGNTSYEYASGATDDYTNNDACKIVSWSRVNSGGKTHPVDDKTANGLDLCDMSGNVWEWCWDRGGDYPSDSVTDYRGASSGSNRVLRSGCWDGDADFLLGYCFHIFPYLKYYFLGLRLVCSNSTAVPDESSPIVVGLQSSGSSSSDTSGEDAPDELLGVKYRDVVPVEGGTYTQESNKGKSFKHTISDFSIGKYQVTYELWYSVYHWAVNHGYSFANAGGEGNRGRVYAINCVNSKKYYYQFDFHQLISQINV